jgi:hypothetical protein
LFLQISRFDEICKNNVPAGDITALNTGKSAFATPKLERHRVHQPFRACPSLAERRHVNFVVKHFRQFYSVNSNDNARLSEIPDTQIFYVLL